MSIYASYTIYDTLASSLILQKCKVTSEKKYKPRLVLKDKITSILPKFNISFYKSVEKIYIQCYVNCVDLHFGL